MNIKRSCGHTEDIAGEITTEGIEYLKSKKCTHCWMTAEAKTIPQMDAAKGMPGCPGFATTTAARAHKNREHFLRTFARDIRGKMWRGTDEQRSAMLAAARKCLANTDPAWWELQTDPGDTLRKAH